MKTDWFSKPKPLHRHLTYHASRQTNDGNILGSDVPASAIRPSMTYHLSFIFTVGCQSLNSCQSLSGQIELLDVIIHSSGRGRLLKLDANLGSFFVLLFKCKNISKLSITCENVLLQTTCFARYEYAWFGLFFSHFCGRDHFRWRLFLYLMETWSDVND